MDKFCILLSIPIAVTLPKFQHLFLFHTMSTLLNPRISESDTLRRTISSNDAITDTSLPETDTLKFISRGKVRDLYSVRDGTDEYLLFVATDRISAFDVVLNNVSEN